MSATMERIARSCICCASADLDRSPAILMPFVACRAFGWTPVEITPDWGLRTIRTGMAYPLCNSLQCHACGVVFLDIRFSDAEMAGIYNGYRGEDYTAQRDEFEPGYRAHNESILAWVADTSWVEGFLAPHLPASPRVLDWGGDNGHNTPFRSRVAAVDILDISDRLLVEGARRVAEADLAPGRHDLIVLSHVLEHMPRPAATLAAIAAVMDRAAVLYVEVPYEPLIAADPEARDLARRKKHWHEHINFYTEASLRALLARSGLAVVDWRTRDLPSHANFSQVMSVACRLAEG